MTTTTTCDVCGSRVFPGEYFITQIRGIANEFSLMENERTGIVNFGENRELDLCQACCRAAMRAAAEALQARLRQTDRVESPV